MPDAVWDVEPQRWKLHSRSCHPTKIYTQVRIIIQRGLRVEDINKS